MQQANNPILTADQFARHIIVDSVNRVIYVQVLYRGDGALKSDEYHAIKQGNFMNLFDKDKDHEVIMRLAQGVAQGYRMEPIIINGKKNNRWYVMEMTNVKFSNFIQAPELLK